MPISGASVSHLTRRGSRFTGTINPTALLELRTNGACTFTLPEELYDLGAPGHYFRRIRSVGIGLLAGKRIVPLPARYGTISSPSPSTTRSLAGNRL